ncbi:hypothetical protein D9599_03340 [Roseomonas sp. KE2513]|uniref:hypothetical protein n=1 Tax=Roseomonas sp. KE2513 TaxID=2479202 RepID=UPI0018E01172|nr:hypothetical protein [Roseomonas sp. KE2513]MBI0534603.1 hypothetical protein [Roseomonas sp. KE2513]
MTKKKTDHGTGDDHVTGRGTVKGQHQDPDANVPEGGEAEAPKGDHGSMKGAASTAEDANAGTGGTSHATVGKREQEQAAAAGAEKTQTGRGHRKHED